MLYILQIRLAMRCLATVYASLYYVWIKRRNYFLEKWILLYRFLYTHNILFLYILQLSIFLIQKNSKIQKIHQ